MMTVMLCCYKKRIITGSYQKFLCSLFVRPFFNFLRFIETFMNSFTIIILLCSCVCFTNTSDVCYFFLLLRKIITHDGRQERSWIYFFFWKLFYKKYILLSLNFLFFFLRSNLLERLFKRQHYWFFKHNFKH